MYSEEFCKWTLSYDDGGIDGECPRCGENICLSYSNDLGDMLDEVIGHLEDKHADHLARAKDRRQTEIATRPGAGGTDGT